MPESDLKHSDDTGVTTPDADSHRSVWWASSTDSEKSSDTSEESPANEEPFPQQCQTPVRNSRAISAVLALVHRVHRLQTQTLHQFSRLQASKPLTAMNSFRINFQRIRTRRQSKMKHSVRHSKSPRYDTPYSRNRSIDNEIEFDTTPPETSINETEMELDAAPPEASSHDSDCSFPLPCPDDPSANTEVHRLYPDLDDPNQLLPVYRDFVDSTSTDLEDASWSTTAIESSRQEDSGPADLLGTPETPLSDLDLDEQGTGEDMANSDRRDDLPAPREAPLANMIGSISLDPSRASTEILASMWSESMQSVTASITGLFALQYPSQLDADHQAYVIYQPNIFSLRYIKYTLRTAQGLEDFKYLQVENVSRQLEKVVRFWISIGARSDRIDKTVSLAHQRTLSRRKADLETPPERLLGPYNSYAFKDRHMLDFPKDVDFVTSYPRLQFNRATTNKAFVLSNRQETFRIFVHLQAELADGTRVPIAETVLAAFIVRRGSRAKFAGGKAPSSPPSAKTTKAGGKARSKSAKQAARKARGSKKKAGAAEQKEKRRSLPRTPAQAAKAGGTKKIVGAEEQTVDGDLCQTNLSRSFNGDIFLKDLSESQWASPFDESHTTESVQQEPATQFESLVNDSMNAIEQSDGFPDSFLPFAQEQAVSIDQSIKSGLTKRQRLAPYTSPLPWVKDMPPVTSASHAPNGSSDRLADGLGFSSSRSAAQTDSMLNMAAPASPPVPLRPIGFEGSSVSDVTLPSIDQLIHGGHAKPAASHVSGDLKDGLNEQRAIPCFDEVIRTMRQMPDEAFYFFNEEGSDQSGADFMITAPGEEISPAPAPGTGLYSSTENLDRPRSGTTQTPNHCSPYQAPNRLVPLLKRWDGEAQRCECRARRRNALLKNMERT